MNEETMTSLSLRDYFAVKAMAAYIQRYSDSKNIATAAYELADNMLKEREKVRTR